MLARISFCTPWKSCFMSAIASATCPCRSGATGNCGTHSLMAAKSHALRPVPVGTRCRT